MTHDRPQPQPQPEAPAPRFDVDMANRQDGRQSFRQNGNLEQRGTLDQRGNLVQDGRVSGTVRQDTNGTVQQNVDGNTLRTGDNRSANDVRSNNSNANRTGDVNSSNQAGGANISDNSRNTDKSVSMGSQFLPECTYGLSIGVPGSGAFQIGVPSKECMVARGQAVQAQAEAVKESARANADAQIGTARAHAEANIINNRMQLDVQNTQAMTKMACDFSIDRAGTARQSWQQFDTVSSRIGKHPTARAGAQQLWGEAVTASAQSMDAGAVCVESTRQQLGIEAKKFEVPALAIETPVERKPVAPKPQHKHDKDCPEDEHKKK